MNFRRPKRKHKAALSLLALALVVSAMGAFVIPEQIRGVAHDLAAPLWAAQARLHAAVAAVPAYVAERRELARELVEVREERDRLIFAGLVNELLREENARLRQVLGRSDEPGVLAAVVARPPVTRYDTLILDAGRAHGVSVGDRVVAHGMALGEIRSVTGKTSIAVLYSSPGEETLVLVRAASTTPTSARGLGSGNFQARVPRDIAVSAGDSVVLPEAPTDVFARVAEVRAHPTDSFQTLLFRLPLGVQELRDVLIIPGV